MSIAPRLKNNLLFCLSLFCTTPIAIACDIEDNPVLMDALLGKERLEQYHYLDSEGKQHFDSLAAFKARETLQKKYFDRINKIDPSESDISCFLLIGAIAYYQNGTATMESYSEQTKPLYEKKPELVFKALAKAPLLIEPVCYYLNNYFGFEDKNKKGKSAFVESFEHLSKTSLPDIQHQRCLNMFKE